MNIHELNNFTGTLGSGAYLAIDDGTDTGKISSQGLLAATEARIDNIIAGPAPSAEEIVDARLGADGVTYPSLGDAIRDQFTDVKSDFNNLNEGLRDIFLTDSTFYNGYYSGATYNGNGEEATPPFSVWNVLLVHVVKNSTITISGMPTSPGTACVWLNSSTLSDVHSVGWNSDASNGTKTCVTDWLAMTGYKIDPSAVSITYDKIGEIDNSINALDGIVDESYEYITQMLDVNLKTSGKCYYPNNTTTTSATGLCLFPPIPLKAGVTYTLENIRGVFTNFKTGGTATSVVSDAGAEDITIAFTPSADGDLYVTGNDSANVMVFDAEYKQANYVFGKFNYKIKGSAIGDSISPLNCTFFKKCTQMLKSAEASAGYWNITSNKAKKASSTGVKAYEPFKLVGGNTYKFVDVYGYFTLIADSQGNVDSRLTDSVANHWTGEYTPTNDCYVYVSVHNDFYEDTGMVLNDAQYMPSQYTEGVYYTYFTGNTENKTVDIHVKTDGTGDYDSVVDAVDFANSQQGNFPINIYIHTGDYDILDELGGDDFLASVLDSVDERQGLVLKANNINLIGVGLVTLRFELDDDVEFYQSSRTSCLNLREFSNRVENLTLIAKNCRYTIHDETNGGNPYIHRVMKNLRCIHKGNAEGLWLYPTVMGGGAGGGSTYDLINCQFITSSYFQACSYHSGANQEASMFNIDGCVGSVKADAPTKNSFRLSYHGTGKTGISVGNIKCCSGNGSCVVEPESSGDTENNIEMYVNGWETIAPITVTGNE